MDYLTIFKKYKQIIKIIRLNQTQEDTKLCIICEKTHAPYIGIPGIFKYRFINYDKSYFVLNCCQSCYTYYKEYIDDLERIYLRDDIFIVEGPTFRIKKQ